MINSPVEMYPDHKTISNHEQQLSTLMCISTSSCDVNPASLSQLTKRVRISLQSLSDHKFVPTRGSLYFNSRTETHLQVQMCKALVERPGEGFMSLCCRDCATEQTGESANVSLLQRRLLPTAPYRQSHQMGICLVTGCSHKQSRDSVTHIFVYAQLSSIRVTRSNVKFPVTAAGEFFIYINKREHQVFIICFDTSTKD